MSLLAVARTEPVRVESVRVGEELRIVMKGVHWYHNPQPFLYFQTWFGNLKVLSTVTHQLRNHRIAPHRFCKQPIPNFTLTTTLSANGRLLLLTLQHHISSSCFWDFTSNSNIYSRDTFYSYTVEPLIPDPHRTGSRSESNKQTNLYLQKRWIKNKRSKNPFV